MKLLDVSTKKFPDTFTKVDDDMFEELNQHKWHFNGRYVQRRGPLSKDGKQTTIRLHKVVKPSPKGKVTDHRWGNVFDNQANSLRICTQNENLRNRKRHSNNSSGFTGVSWYAAGKKWVAYIRINTVRKYLGYFEDKIEAALAYNAAALKEDAEFFNLNIIEPKHHNI